LTGLASVRTVTVKDKKYLQVVRYEKNNGKYKTKVIKSFGRDNLENRLKANQFSSTYNSLADIARKEMERDVALERILSLALGLFGLILGAAIVKELLEEIFTNK
jgi:hypothetical protein